MPRVAFDRSGGIGIAERERPAVVHHSAHETIEAATTRGDVHTEFDVDRVFNPTSLRAPEPRNGFHQRWVADGTNPNADRSEQRNWFAKKQAGYSPRDPDTVPQRERHLYPSQKLGDGQTCIRIANQVLCEIPLHVFRARNMAVRDKIDQQSSSVPDSSRVARDRGFRGASPMEVVDQSRTVRGRMLPNGERGPALSDADIRDII